VIHALLHHLSSEDSKGCIGFRVASLASVLKKYLIRAILSLKSTHPETAKSTSFALGRNLHSAKDPLTPRVPNGQCLSSVEEDFDAGNQNDNTNERHLLHAMMLTIL
jgi:hypothetical protein